MDDGRSGEVKRVIGVPGEGIEYREDHLYVEQEVIVENFFIKEIIEQQEKGRRFTEDFSNFTLVEQAKIPTNYYLFLGDNHPHTTDSRDYGLVHQSKLKGKVVNYFLSLARGTTFLVGKLLVSELKKSSKNLTA